jgi:hypothetical protein
MGERERIESVERAVDIKVSICITLYDVARAGPETARLEANKQTPYARSLNLDGYLLREKIYADNFEP